MTYNFETNLDGFCDIFDELASPQRAENLVIFEPFSVNFHTYEKPQGFMLQLIVDDIDFWWDRAVKAGVEVVTPVELMFWGARWGQVKDPFGIIWGFNEVKK